MMKKLSFSSILFAVAGAAYLAGSWRAPRETLSAAVTSAPRTVSYYHCPMHPEITSDKPGTTPCCGMAFEPVYADPPSAPAAGGAHPSPEAAVVSPQQQQLMGVRVGTLEETSATERVQLFGRVLPDESRVRKLTVGVNGYIREAIEATTGSYVRKGQVLARFATIDMRQPIAGYISALDVLEREQKSGGGTPGQIAAATVSTDLTLDRLLTLGMSRVQIEQIRRTRVIPTEIQVISPIDGLVLTRNVASGQRFDAGAELFQIADLERVWIVADVPTDAADQIRAGTAAEVTVNGRSTGVRAHASASVPPQFDPSTQSFKFRLDADNPGLRLRPDMFVDVAFDVSYPPAMLVPADAVVFSGLRSHVFVERSAGVFEAREVQAGRRQGGRLAIVKGLQPGERIALSGTFLLDSESRMKSSDRPHH